MNSETKTRLNNITKELDEFYKENNALLAIYATGNIASIIKKNITFIGKAREDIKKAESLSEEALNSVIKLYENKLKEQKETPIKELKTIEEKKAILYKEVEKIIAKANKDNDSYAYTYATGIQTDLRKIDFFLNNKFDANEMPTQKSLINIINNLNSLETSINEFNKPKVKDEAKKPKDTNDTNNKKKASEVTIKDRRKELTKYIITACVALGIGSLATAACYHITNDKQIEKTIETDDESIEETVEKVLKETQAKKETDIKETETEDHDLAKKLLEGLSAPKDLANQLKFTDDYEELDSEYLEEYVTSLIKKHPELNNYSINDIENAIRLANADIVNNKAIFDDKEDLLRTSRICSEIIAITGSNEIVTTKAKFVNSIDKQTLINMINAQGVTNISIEEFDKAIVRPNDTDIKYNLFDVTDILCKGLYNEDIEKATSFGYLTNELTANIVCAELPSEMDEYTIATPYNVIGAYRSNIKQICDLTAGRNLGPRYGAAFRPNTPIEGDTENLTTVNPYGFICVEDLTYTIDPEHYNWPGHDFVNIYTEDESIKTLGLVDSYQRVKK